MRTIIKGGHVVDPGNHDKVMDIVIEDGKIVEAGDCEDGPDDNTKTIDAAGRIVAPGFIDMHVHLRDPGQEYKETIASGCLAAAHGGFTAVCSMPNTNPVNDNRQVTEYILKNAENAGTSRVYPVAAISRGLSGEALSEYRDLKDAGAVAVSDDGRPVSDSQFMRRALEYAKGFGIPVISHCEDLGLVADGVMNEGAVASRMGLAGIPNVSESSMVMRDISLCELTETSLHIAHVSTEESVRVIRAAKKRGVPVTAETAPHYFTLTEEYVKQYNTNAKMNPPLRSARDRDAVLEGLADG
ncbi:MAG: dihydroorotase, partial [Gammaproteobacteria bacterium]|nr:dihydroorotase [Gammaproteobacteria bacterium]